uniref:Uncharacterized protein n=1 Tax=Pithovirus LCPAC401 TaxID=2506595 RepID=A0A481Z912_9VIRU|nr:MAG: uncharacterized protein LCPAC401_00310 [Pithovirus LCPAC401]
MLKSDEKKFDLLEINESEERLFIINKVSLATDPENWPEDSMPRLMYEGDRDASEYVINNSKMNRESIELIKSVVIKETKGPVLNLIDVDWDNFELTVRYLGLGVGIDFLYPLFLVPDDKAMWYDECESRISHVCQYRPEDDGDLLEMNLSDVITTNSPYITLNNLNLHPEKLEMLRQFEEKEEIKEENQNINDLIEEIKEENQNINDLIDEIIQTLSNVSDLLIVRDVALARFRGIKFLIKIGRRDKIINKVTNVDVFVYGPDALEHIIEAVRLCLELSKKNFKEYQRSHNKSEEITFIRVKDRLTPSRTRHKIKIPVMSRNSRNILDVMFPLVKLHSKRDILTKIPLDCFAIGFDPKNPNMFYGLPRTYRSLDTMTNVVDPTRNGIKYFDMLNSVSNTGFDIAIPGFNIDKLPCSDKILKILNLARIAELFEERGKYILPPRGTSTEVRQQIRQDREEIRQSVFKIRNRMADMKLSGLVLLLVRIIYGRVDSYHRNRYSDSEIAMEHERIIILPRPMLSIYKHPDRARVIFGDVLNQSGREFRITAIRRYLGNDITEDLTYTPLFPKIELLSFDLPTALYQVRTSFYGQYTCVEDIDVPDDVERKDANVYELLNVLSQRTL